MTNPETFRENESKFGSKERPISKGIWEHIEQDGCLLTPTCLAKYFPAYDTLSLLPNSTTVFTSGKNLPSFETPIIISINGPSGGGKDTSVNFFRSLKRNTPIPEGIHVPDFIFKSPHTIRIIRTTTSREPRPDDHCTYTRDGKPKSKQYTFVTHKEFEQRIVDHTFVEWMPEESGYYGTPKNAMVRIPKGTKILLWRANIEGLESFKKLHEKDPNTVFPPFVGLFILPELKLSAYRNHVSAK
jgi:hypothetical protein